MALIGALEDIEIWKLQSHCGRYKKMIRFRCGAARVAVRSFQLSHFSSRRFTLLYYILDSYIL